MSSSATRYNHAAVLLVAFLRNARDESIAAVVGLCG